MAGFLTRYEASVTSCREIDSCNPIVFGTSCGWVSALFMLCIQRRYIRLRRLVLLTYNLYLVLWDFYLKIRTVVREVWFHEYGLYNCLCAFYSFESACTESHRLELQDNVH